MSLITIKEAKENENLRQPFLDQYIPRLFPLIDTFYYFSHGEKGDELVVQAYKTGRLDNTDLGDIKEWRNAPDARIATSLLPCTLGKGVPTIMMVTPTSFSSDEFNKDFERHIMVHERAHALDHYQGIPLELGEYATFEHFNRGEVRKRTLENVSEVRAYADHIESVLADKDFSRFNQPLFALSEYVLMLRNLKPISGIEERLKSYTLSEAEKRLNLFGIEIEWGGGIRTPSDLCAKPQK